MTRLFDSDGLPWITRVRWGLLYFGFAGIAFLLAPVIGMYLGIWLRTKCRSWLVFVLYAFLFVGMSLLYVGPVDQSSRIVDLLSAAVLVLWLTGAFVLRLQVQAYYEGRERTPFALNYLLTCLFGPWYIGGRLRADFPLDSAGKVGSGNLRLVS